MAKRTRWNLEKVREVAEGKTPAELQASHQGAYNWAWRNNQLDNIGLAEGRFLWSLEKVREVADGKTSKELETSHIGAYNWACRNNQLDNIGLVKTIEGWNLEKVREVAEGKTAMDLHSSYSGAYEWACRNKQLHNIGLVRVRERWNLEKVREVAEGKTARELYVSHGGAYNWANRNDQLDNIGLVENEGSLMNRWGKELAEDMELCHSTEYADPSCCGKSPLRFDLAIHDYYGLQALIEFQGRQHFEPQRFSSSVSKEEAEQNLKSQKRRDQIKRDWCAKNGIPLIEISYIFRNKGEQAFKAELRRQLKSIGIC